VPRARGREHTHRAGADLFGGGTGGELLLQRLDRYGQELLRTSSVFAFAER
jgi:hypothetical protein